jgi:hypothetical protein
MERGKKRDKKIVMVKLIIQEKRKIGTATKKSSVCSVKVLDLFLWCPILVLVLGILDFVGKGATPLDRQFGFFSHFSWSYGPSVTRRRSEVVSPGDWVVNRIWFLLSTE